MIQEIKKQNEDKLNLEFFGITGPRMKLCGVSTIFDFTKINYLGFSEIIFNFLPLKIKLNKLIKKVKSIKPDILITIDAKLFSLLLAKDLKKEIYQMILSLYMLFYQQYGHIVRQEHTNGKMFLIFWFQLFQMKIIISQYMISKLCI